MKLNDEERRIIVNEKSDYNCVYVTTAEEMRPLFEPVREFIAKVGNLIKE